MQEKKRNGSYIMITTAIAAMNPCRRARLKTTSINPSLKNPSMKDIRPVYRDLLYADGKSMSPYLERYYTSHPQSQDIRISGGINTTNLRDGLPKKKTEGSLWGYVELPGGTQKSINDSRN